MCVCGCEEMEDVVMGRETRDGGKRWKPSCVVVGVGSRSLLFSSRARGMPTCRKRRDEAEAVTIASDEAEGKQYQRVHEIENITSIQLSCAVIQVVAELQREKRFLRRTRLLESEHVISSVLFGLARRPGLQASSS